MTIVVKTARGDACRCDEPGKERGPPVALEIQCSIRWYVLFQEPKQLELQQTIDHCIPLKNESQAMSTPPYWLYQSFIIVVVLGPKASRTLDDDIFVFDY